VCCGRAPAVGTGLQDTHSAVFALQIQGGRSSMWHIVHSHRCNHALDRALNPTEIWSAVTCKGTLYYLVRADSSCACLLCCLSACMPACLPARPSVCLFVFACLSVCLPACLPARLPFHLSVCPSPPMCVCVLCCLPACPPACLPALPCICLPPFRVCQTTSMMQSTRQSQGGASGWQRSSCTWPHQRKVRPCDTHDSHAQTPAHG
jgi:hypothetical protein